MQASIASASTVPQTLGGHHDSIVSQVYFTCIFYFVMLAFHSIYVVSMLEFHGTFLMCALGEFAG
jgi:hypothetical protein